jgi:hypothetical protein
VRRAVRGTARRVVQRHDERAPRRGERRSMGKLAGSVRAERTGLSFLSVTRNFHGYCDQADGSGRRTLLGREAGVVD